MLFVIAAHTINTVYGELFCFSNNGNTHDGWWRKKVLHGGVERNKR
jgi:hypothetical protein